MPSAPQTIQMKNGVNADFYAFQDFVVEAMASVTADVVRATHVPVSSA